MRRFSGASLFFLCAFLAAGSGAPAAAARPAAGEGGGEGATVTVVRAARVFCGGAWREGGAVLVREGRIARVGAGLRAPEGARLFAPEGEFSLTPGLVDAAAVAGVSPREAWAEQGEEVIPRLRNLDALDLDDPSFARLAEGGVTTVFVTPDPSSVIGCRGAVVKTGGPRAGRVVVAAGDVKANLGPETWRRGSFNRPPYGKAVDFRARRPTTRMGSTWVFREAFYKALAFRAAVKAGRSPSPPDPDTAVLLQVLEGGVRLRFQAREDIDIWSALRLAEEFRIPGVVLEEATEVYRCIPEVKARGAAVIFGPIFVTPRGSRSRSGEALRPCPGTPRLLAEAGIPFALTAADLSGEDGLVRQAAYAVRWGLPPDRAMRAVTLEPARILGIADRVGDLAPGMDGDLVLWRGTPPEPDARPVLVLIRGGVVFRDERLFPGAARPGG